MGADFISYCVFGPKKLSTSKTVLKKAEKVVKEYVALACELDELVKRGCDSSQGRLERDEADEEVRSLMDKHGIECVEDVRWACNYRSTPTQFLDEFFDVWNNYSRDSAGRDVPGRPKQKVWYAGDMSWGDEPDGYGYQTMKKADMCGLLPIFGLE